jgi:hypothetical protein
MNRPWVFENGQIWVFVSFLLAGAVMSAWIRSTEI